MRLKLRKITSVSVKNSSFISEVFQTEDSGALLQSRGKLHKQKCFSAGSQKGDHFLQSSYVLSAQNIHFNDWGKYLPSQAKYFKQRIQLLNFFPSQKIIAGVDWYMNLSPIFGVSYALTDECEQHNECVKQLLHRTGISNQAVIYCKLYPFLNENQIYPARTVNCSF